MYQNQITNINKNNVGDEYQSLSELDSYRNLMKELTAEFNTNKKLHKQHQKTIRQRIMVMREYRKKKREEFRKSVREEFLKLFTGYILF